MEALTQTRPSIKRATTREELMALGQEINARLGIVGGPMTPKEAKAALKDLHASMLAHGIRPEDKGASRELLQMRYGPDYDQDDKQVLTA